MLSSLGTLQSGLYQKYADKHNLKLFLPNAVQAEQAQSCINLIKGNDFRQAAERMENLVQELWQKQDLLIMTACTELPLAYAASNLDKNREVSSLGALADACVLQLYSC